MDLNKMGKFIAQMRKEKNLTQDQLGEKLGGFDRRTISKWETGKIAPDISLLEPIANLLDITVDELLKGECNDTKTQNNNHSFDTDKIKNSKTDLTTNNGETLNKDTKVSTEVVKFYNKIYKNKIFKRFICAIVSLSIMFIITILVLNYNKYNISNLSSSNEDFHINGTLIYNKKNFIVSLNNITYSDIYMGTDKEITVKRVKVSLLNDKNLLISYEAENNKPVYINEILKNITINYDNLTKQKAQLLKDLSITLELIDENNNQDIITIPLNK